MKRFFAHIIFFVLFFINQGYCQYFFKNLSAEDGLSSNQVNCIIKDSEGFIWLGTNDGLNRFDGSEILSFNNNPMDSLSISDNYIWCLFQDQSGLIWIGTKGGGINCLNPKTLLFKNYVSNDQINGSISSDESKLIFEDSYNNLWIAVSDQGIDLYNKQDDSFENFKPTDQIDGLSPRLANSIISFTLDPHDSAIIWLGSLQGVFSFDISNKHWTYFPIEKHKSLNPKLFGGREGVVRSMHFDKDGYLWLGTWGGGLCKLNTTTGIFSIYKYEALSPVNGIRNNIKEILPKSDFEFYLLTRNKGIGVYNIDNHSISYLSNPESGKTYLFNPYDMIVDRHGFIWITSLSNGLFYTNINAHQFNKQYTSHNILSCNSSKNNNTIWAGTTGKAGKLLSIDLIGHQVKEFNYSLQTDMDIEFMKDVFESDDNKVWIIGYHNLFYLDIHTNQVFNYSKFNTEEFNINKPHKITFVSGELNNKNEIWIGTKFHGLFKINTADETIENFFFTDTSRKDVYFEDFIFTLFEDSQKRVWYGSAEFGYVDPKDNTIVNFSYSSDIPNSTISLKNVMAITETEDNNIWLGTGNTGIGVIKMMDDSITFIRSYSKIDGLVDDRIRSLSADNSGNIWAITSKGLSKINPRNNTIQNYDSEYGLNNLSCICPAKNGEIFMGTNNGYYVFDPEKIKPVQNYPKPYIKTIKVFDKPLELGTSRDDPLSLNFSYKENFFSIEYSTINYFNSERTEYRYMLEGLDEDWRYAGKRKYISYTNLSGGYYKFRLKVIDGEELIIPIFIQTPFWKTWWFIGLLIIAFISLSLLIHFYRLKQIQKQENLKSLYNKKISQLEMKALRAQMNPHFLFNSLNSIRYYILKNENENASDYITKFSRLLRLILSNSRQNQISLKDELHALKIYIDFERMRFNNKFEYEINIAKEINSDVIKIQPMIIQPFVENAIWHGLMPKKGNGKLLVNIEKNDGSLKIMVIDNGIGRIKAKEQKDHMLAESKSYGLKITQDRMQLMKKIRDKKSNFEIIDLYNEKNESVGTKAIITYDI